MRIALLLKLALVSLRNLAFTRLPSMKLPKTKDAALHELLTLSAIDQQAFLMPRYYPSTDSHYSVVCSCVW